MSKAVRTCLILAAGLVVAASALAQGKRTVIGILPVYDNSGQSLTENLPVNLTFMIYRDLLKDPTYQPVLLSPGAFYDADSVDSITDYAAKEKVDTLLVTSILPCVKINNLRCRLKFETSMMNIASGKSSPKVTNDSVDVLTVDLVSMAASAYAGSKNFEAFLKGPEDFEKQPIGKSAAKLAEWTKGVVGTTLPTLAVTSTGTEATIKPEPCDMDVHVRYVTKKTVSKSYTLIVNDKDETSMVKDGVAHFTIPSGPLVFRVQVTDPPYAMPVEKFYQSSAVLDCAAISHTLSMDIGSAGEMLTHWQ